MSKNLYGTVNIFNALEKSQRNVFFFSSFFSGSRVTCWRNSLCVLSLTFHKPSDLYVIVLSFVVSFFPPSVFLPLPSVLCRIPCPHFSVIFYHASPISLRSGLALKPMLRFRVTLLIRVQLKLDMARLGLFACLSIALSVCAFNTENNLFVHWPTKLVPLLWSYQPTRYLV